MRWFCARATRHLELQRRSRVWVSHPAISTTFPFAPSARCALGTGCSSPQWRSRCAPCPGRSPARRQRPRPAMPPAACPARSVGRRRGWGRHSLGPCDHAPWSRAGYQAAFTTCCHAQATKLPEALLFDCDGVLVDTEKDGHRVSFNEAFKRKGGTPLWPGRLLPGAARSGCTVRLHWPASRQPGDPAGCSGAGGRACCHARRRPAAARVGRGAVRRAAGDRRRQGANDKVLQGAAAAGGGWWWLVVD